MSPVGLLLLLGAATVAVSASRSRHAREVYTNHYSVHVPAGHEAAHKIAKRHGFVNLGSVGLQF